MHITEKRPIPSSWGVYAAFGLTLLFALLVVTAFWMHWLPLAALRDTWLLTRAAGLVAFLLLWLSILFGLFQSTGLLRGRLHSAITLELHNTLAIWSLYATTFHMVILLWDRYIHFDLMGILVPFASTYRPVLTGLGSMAAYVGLAATVTTYFRRHLNPLLWRSIHLASLVAFLLALLHGALLGTDTRIRWISVCYVVSGLSLLPLLAYRIYLARQRRPAKATP
jgi:sulfoxide reductase heme-binding subunit YedZ